MNTQTTLASAVMATLNQLAVYEGGATGHEPLAALLALRYGAAECRQVTEFGEEHTFGWCDSGTMDFWPVQQGAKSPAQPLYDFGYSLQARLCTNECAFNIYEQSQPSPDGTKLVLIEVDWAHSESAATYGGLFELAAE